MASPRADLNELSTTQPARMLIDVAAGEEYWPGLDELSDYEEGFSQRRNEAVVLDDRVEGNTDLPDLNRPHNPERRKELSNNQGLEVLQALLERSEAGKLKRGATNDIAAQFGASLRTIQRIWKRARDSGKNDYANYRVKNCGRKRIDFDIERMRSIPFSKRTTIRALAFSLGVSKTFLYSKLKEGIIRRHSNAIKPSLTPENHNARLNHCVSSFDPATLPHDPTFTQMESTVHIDEKWFYLTKKSQTYYLLHDEVEPVRSNKSSNFIPKVMFLAAVARPRYDSNGLCTFDGKLGVFPLVHSVPAVRSSQYRPRGTIEIKPIGNITREVIREFMINKVLPAIVNKWPRENLTETIYIQQDNAKSHIPTDDIQFLCAVQDSGMSISLVCQPPNSPDLNVLDLGFFRAIQSLQSQNCAKNIVDLIGAVEQAFQDFPANKCNNVWLTLQSCMVQILKCDGGNNYKIPHMKKQQLARQGVLPSAIRCSPHVFANAVGLLPS